MCMMSWVMLVPVRDNQMLSSLLMNPIMSFDLKYELFLLLMLPNWNGVLIFALCIVIEEKK